MCFPASWSDCLSDWDGLAMKPFIRPMADLYLVYRPHVSCIKYSRRHRDWPLSLDAELFCLYMEKRRGIASLLSPCKVEGVLWFMLFSWVANSKWTSAAAVNSSNRWTSCKLCREYKHTLREALGHKTEPL